MSWYNDLFKSKTSAPVCEHFNSAKFVEMFGDNWLGISYYDFDAACWHPCFASGCLIEQLPPDASDIVAMRKNIESMSEFKSRELVAALTMPIKVIKPGSVMSPFVSNPVFDNGRDVVGTIVVRDTQTGRIMQPAKNWVAVRRFGDVSDAFRNGGRVFAKNCMDFNSPYVKMLLHFMRWTPQR